jgi:BioD-like phosphotransacetylase family protein
MSVLLIASSEPRVGRSVIAAALAYRAGRDGAPATLVRLAGDDAAEADAATFATLEYIGHSAKPLSAEDVKKLSGDVIAEAPAGSVQALASALGARVLAVAEGDSPAVDAEAIGTIVTHVPAHEVEAVRTRPGVLAAIAEDRTLAGPSAEDIAAALRAEWLVQNDGLSGIDRVMIGTVASDAASPYFGNRERKCVVTRYDKTDIQLAALLTDMELLVLTGGGQPSPYLMDRVSNTRDDLAVLLTRDDTPEAMRAIEGLFARSRFDGAGKMMRMVELLDEAGFALPD